MRKERDLAVALVHENVKTSRIKNLASDKRISPFIYDEITDDNRSEASNISARKANQIVVLQEQSQNKNMNGKK